MSTPPEAFQGRGGNHDPRALRRRWYEQRKRDLILATLQRQRYQRIFEPACASGELSLGLSERCDELVCMDVSPGAIAQARQRLNGHEHVHIQQGRLPGDWPAGEFDLVVLSEFGYCLDQDGLLLVIERAVASLTTDGALLACHWLHPIEGCPLDGRQVHFLLEHFLHFHRTVLHEETDFLLEYWCRRPCAIDVDEGIL
ncbi:nodulation S family protein [Pseudomonas sp. LS1212]|uniref:methyltransferase domain-containing protein n=1 Tax=Pseudomonas sp. LS1212 TaxID=2972478 RepID=UPI00215C9861|nr:class I SAM-dependent methyltransferase [Pseudomonas sp. LS1212]UVJ41795.1 nodulation S family protein [Pseudomonas sp. LS1212]